MDKTELSDPFEILCSLASPENVEKIKMIIESNKMLDVNQKSGLLLNFAVMSSNRFKVDSKKNSLEIVKLLHKAGADLGINEGYNVELAMECNNVEMVKYIIENINFIPKVDQHVLEKFYEKYPEEKTWLSERVKGIEINVEELLSTLQPANNMNENENTRKLVTEKRKLSPQDEKNENFVKRLKVDDKDNGLKVR